MPYTCCVPACRGNYDKQNQVHVFQFPKDDILKNKWLHAIPRTDFVWTKNSRVCEKHFKEGDVLHKTTFINEKTGQVLSATLKRPQLKKDAIPSIFPGCPSYLSHPTTSRESPEEKRLRLELQQMEQSIADSVNSTKEYAAKRHFTTFSELQNCLKNHTISDYWTVVVKSETLLFMDISVIENIPSLKYAVTISRDLKLNVSFKGQNLLKYNGRKLPIEVNSINQVLEVLQLFEQSNVVSEKSLHCNLDIVESILKNSIDLFNDKAKFLVEFFIEQLNLLKLKPERYTYSSSMLIFASILFYISPQSYKFIRNSCNVILPDPSTIRKISSTIKNSPQFEEQDNHFLFHAQQTYSKLKDFDKYVFIMIDEIHIKPFLDYKGGNLVGMAYDSANLANSVHVFMLQSIFSSFKDVIHIVPVSTFNSDKLFNLMKKVLLGLEDIGFKVLGIVTDNNAINRKAISNFENPPKFQIKYKHPADSSRPLFYVIDSVHLIKCVRNNWLNQRNGFFMYYPSFDEKSDSIAHASLTTVRKLYDLECTKLLKFGYGLTRKALWPTNLERQNVKLALKVFNLNIVRGLEELGPKYELECYQQTANYIQIFCSWWDIVNVKTSSIGKHKLNPLCEPFTGKGTDANAIFLNKFISWLKRWDVLDSNNGRLSKETHSALIHTTSALVNIAEYCTNDLNKSYILLGKIQTDKLESRFGQYRSMSGDHYHISIRQLYESESKLRLSRELKLASHAKGDIKIDIFDNVSDLCNNDKQSFDAIFSDITVDDTDIKKVSESLPVIIYLAGYCGHVVHKKVKCFKCREKVVTDRELISEKDYKLIKATDRGGLLYPTEVVTNAVLHTFIVIQKLIEEKYEGKFMKVSNQRSLVINLVEEILIAKDVFPFLDCCIDGHDFQPLIQTILRSATNCLLNNYCKIKNDSVKDKTVPKITVAKKEKRKLETFKNSNLKDENVLKKSKSNLKDKV